MSSSIMENVNSIAMLSLPVSMIPDLTESCIVDRLLTDILTRG